jgi:hypothetical protein
MPDGYVYLLRSHKLHKIGISRDVEQRLRTIRTMSPSLVFLLHRIPTNDMRRSEQFLHDLFARRREHGEWFRLNPTDVKLICDCKALCFE